jgi:DNA-binding MarR family transcriptional regulator
MKNAPDFSQLLQQAHRRVSRELERTLREAGASAEQWRVLELLADETGRPIGELANTLDINPPTMTKLIDRMVARAWVQRIVDEQDNRRVLVFVTDSGLALMKKLSRRAENFFDGLSSGFSKSEAAQLRRLLTFLARD